MLIMSVNLSSENTTPLDHNIPHKTSLNAYFVISDHHRWLSLILAILIALGVYVLLHITLMYYVVGGSSMMPTLTSGEQLLVNRWSYVWSAPQRGDLVVFNLQSDHGLVKRVVGLPGETVEFRGGVVYINGEHLPEPYLLSACDHVACADGIWQLGADAYFVLGDNRHHSSDSRVFGAIAHHHIVGAVVWHAVLPLKLNSLHQDWTQE
ncbi:MAG: signal peptidase I [Anaerolineae bacterium]